MAEDMKVTKKSKPQARARKPERKTPEARSSQVTKQPSRVPESGGTEAFGWATPLADLRRQMDRVFEDFLSPWRSGHLARRLEDFGFPQSTLLGKPVPADLIAMEIDVSETDKTVEIAAELPGLDEKDVEVTVEDDVLTIQGEKRVEHEEKDKNYFLSERRYGSFHRSFHLTDRLDPTKIEAKFDKGVLHVSIAKRPEPNKAAARKVPVKS